MKTRLALALLAVLATASNVSAGYVPIVVPVDTSPAAGQGGGCMPPVEWSIEHNCSLSFSDKYAVNTFDCGACDVTGDCKGGVVKVTCIDYNKYYGIAIVGGGILIAAFAATIASLRTR